jgi:hypothetical protein
LQDVHSPIQGQPHFVQGALVIFGIGFLALIAAEPLQAVSMLSESFALALAVVAGHCGFPLKTTARLPDNEFVGSSRRKL